MSFMTTNYKNVQESSFEPLPQSEYEMIINKAQEGATKNGKEKLQIDLVVREDLDNVKGMEETNKKYHRRHVFNDIWKQSVGGNYQYDTSKFQYILDAIGVPENYEINSVDELIELITGRAVRVFVKKQYSEYNKADENTIAPWGYKKSEFPLNKQQPSFERDGQSSIDIDSEDLPF